MTQTHMNSGGTVVAFRSTGSKNRRASAPRGEERGAVLLFTGIRYDRTHAEAGPLGAPAASPEGDKAGRTG
jgi:hypothetical protein